MKLNKVLQRREEWLVDFISEYEHLSPQEYEGDYSRLQWRLVEAREYIEEIPTALKYFESMGNQDVKGVHSLETLWETLDMADDSELAFNGRHIKVVYLWTLPKNKPMVVCWAESVSGVYC